MIAFYWRTHRAAGCRIVAGPFATAEEAGEWRRDNPPKGGLSLLKLVNLRPVELSAGDYADCFVVFADREEERVA